MPPAKHGKNATANPVYSASERAKDIREGQYGTQKRRALTESIQAFDCCHLSSQPAKNPVITPHGILFDKEYIMENLLYQKQQYKKKMKEYERQREKYEADQAKLTSEADDLRVKAFVKMEHSAAQSGSTAFVKKEEAVGEAGRMLRMKKETIQTEEGRVVPKLPSFWIPSLTPGAKATEITPPSNKTTCPITNKPLKLKDLIPVKFTPADKHSKQKMEARHERYVCAITQKVLRNCIPCVVLKPSGRVITQEAYERLVQPDMVDPISSTKLQASDIIKMHSAGTGFAEKGGEIKKVKTAAMTGG
eukprot:m.40594 g.40594  ORF g.40594 m.40594 type:complete len:305 (-) comp14837_c0_seq2:436-1350(-)